jgi:hypothetical protein
MPTNVGDSGTFTYNGTTYNFYAGFSTAFSTYSNGDTSTQQFPWMVGHVPLMVPNTWNHIALTISGTNTNTVYTLYFNGTPYVLGSSQFYMRNNNINSGTGSTSPSVLGYPTFAGNGNIDTGGASYGTVPMNIKNLLVDNRCLTSAQITALMQMA